MYKSNFIHLVGVALLLFSLDGYAWYNSSWNYRVPINIPGGATINSTIKLSSVDFTSLLTTLGVSGTLDVNSVRVVRSDDVTLSTTQEFTDSLYNSVTDLAGNGRGEIKFLLQDVGATTYYLYFDITANGSKAVNPQTSINGNFEQGIAGTQSPAGWTAVKANAGFDAQVRATENPSITTDGTGNTVVTDGTPLTGAFSYLLGGRTNNEPVNASPSVTLSRNIVVPATSPGNLVFSYRSEGWDSSDNGATTWDYLRIKLVGTTTTEIVGPTYGNYVTYPFSPNKSTSAISASVSGYGSYNYWDMSSNGTHHSGMTLLAGSQPWFTRTVALTSYVGQTITLQITMNESISYKSWAHIDDVEWSVVSATLGTPAAKPPLHHVEIDHSTGTGLTCAASTLIIKACQDAFCVTAYTGGLSGTLTATGTPVTTWDGSTGGATGAGFVIPLGSSTVTKNVQVTSAGTVVFGTTALAPGASSSTTCNFGSPSCTFTASKTGFLFSNTTTGSAYTIPSQISGTTSDTLYLRSIQASTTNAAVCSVGTTGTTTQVNISYTCNNPASCQSGSLVTINSTPISSSGTFVSLSFDANAAAPVTVRYDDVGQITLNASNTGSTAGTVNGSSNAFVVKPFSFVLSDIKQTASPQRVNPVAADVSGSKFVKAGEVFTATVTSTNMLGNATPNYGKEITPESILLSNSSASNPIAPAGGNNPSVSGGFGAFNNGVSVGTALIWNEVGIIRLTPSVLDGDYLGAGDITGTTSGNIGRFYPASFKLSAAALINRTDIAGCIAPCGTYTYIGEPMNALFTLKAMAVDGSTTLTNYTSANQFAKLDPASTGNPLGLGVVDAGATRTPFPVCGETTPAYPCFTPSIATAGSFALGAANIIVPITIYRGATPVGPYLLLDIGIAPRDSDGVILSNYDIDTINIVEGTSNHAKIDRSQLRYGRINLQNAYGSELLDLPMSLTAEYWNGNNWIISIDDQYTIGLTLTKAVVTGPIAIVCAWDTGVGNGSSGLGCSLAGTGINQFRQPPLITDGGNFNLNLKAPGIGNTGAIDITAAVPAYLMFNWKGTGNTSPTTARATFGIYKGNSKIIYIRELY